MAQRITVDIVAETAQLRAGLEQANQQLSGLQAGVTKINQVTSAVAGIGVAAAGLGKATGFITQAASAASDLQETTSKVGQIFGDASDEVLKFSQGTAKSLGQSSQQALDAAANFGIFGKAAGLTGKDLANFSTDFTVLASDLASFNNTSPQDAINALGGALRGEAEPLRRYGVLLNEDALKAQALTLGLTKANVNINKVSLAQAKANKAAKAYADAIKKYGDNSAEAAEKQALLQKAEGDLAKATSGVSEKLTQSQKILAAQAIIYEQTKDAQGDFARTSDGLANSQRILAATQADLNTSLGKTFLPVMEKVTQVVQIAVDIFTKLPGPIQTLVVGFGLLVATIGPLIILINSVKTALVALEVAKLASAAASGVLTGATTLLSAAMTALPFIAIIALIVLLVKNWDTVTEVVGKVWDKIKEFGALVVPFIKDIFGKVAEFVSDAWDKVFNTTKEIVGKVIDWLKNNWPLILAVLTGPFGLFAKFLIDHKEEIVGKVSGIWNGIKDTISNIGNATKDAATGIFDKLKNNLVTNTENTYTALTSGWNFIKGSLGDIVEFIKINVGTKFLEMFLTVVDWVTQIKNGVVNKFTELKDAAINQFNKLKDSASKIWDNIKGFITDVANNIKNKLGEVFGFMVEVGKDIARGIASGLSQMGNFTRTFLTEWVNNNILKHVKKLLGINSPSTVMMDVGKNMSQGLGIGLNTLSPSTIPSLTKASTPAVNITINAGVGTDPYALGRQVQQALTRYGKLTSA